MSIQTANGRVTCDAEIGVWVSLLSVFVWARVLPSAPRLLSLGALCTDHGFRFAWPSGSPRL
eukprot:1154831-Alexandrium_andersonii.AAC.1